MLSLVIIAERHGLRAINIAAIEGHGLVPRLLEVRKFDSSSTPAHAAVAVQPRSFWQSVWFANSFNAFGRKVVPMAVEEAAHEIEYVLDRYQPDHWGLAAPGDCVDRLLGHLSEDRRSNLGQVLDRDLSSAEAAQILEEFIEYQPV